MEQFVPVGAVAVGAMGTVGVVLLGLELELELVPLQLLELHVARDSAMDVVSVGTVGVGTVNAGANCSAYAGVG